MSTWANHTRSLQRCALSWPTRRAAAFVPDGSRRPLLLCLDLPPRGLMRQAQADRSSGAAAKSGGEHMPPSQAGRDVRTNAELAALHAVGTGFVYSHYSSGASGSQYNRLHAARCDGVGKMIGQAKPESRPDLPQDDLSDPR